jgi:putative ATP-dependent endonuclease of OLD family
LHPVNQRLIYKDVIQNSNNSVLLTTHSTHITSIAPIASIVHLHMDATGGTAIHSTADMPMKKGEFLDVERYLDVKRGEIYLGKGVILVEGIAEEYLVPRFADLLGKSLDKSGIVVCNINCTNFTPYVKMLRSLDIPYVVITDGDFYYNGKDDERVYHTMYDEDSEVTFGYLGMEIIEKLVNELKLIGDKKIPEDLDEADVLYRSLGLFVGNYTFEVDMMEKATNTKRSAKAHKVLVELFNELTTGGATQKSNFKKELAVGEYWKCLKKIEGNGIGKGRFSQRLVSVCMEEHIPDYVRLAIEYIYKKVSK